MWDAQRTPALQARKQVAERSGEVTQAVATLRHSGYAELSRIVCDFYEGVLTLTGHVPSYYHKQMAQMLVLRRLPEVELRNELEVFDSQM